ncbi:zinc finger CCCH domain-containing protein 3-like isoform X2 [Miscanthus floridulus]|uniref:zinc finger CCCH domain-containing protein 3-like isoform X2 n=1 Tax=Miscanthus floridulus TaxID=154761 RepID=UPI00345A9FC5
MPLGKYYCDYCDKQFQDTPAARRRHLQGVQHQRARALWYDSIRHQEQHGGASSLLLPDGTLAKGICHHFVRTGACKYGDSCRYFHPKPDGVNPALAAPGNILGVHILLGQPAACHCNLLLKAAILPSRSSTGAEGAFSLKFEPFNILYLDWLC